MKRLFLSTLFAFFSTLLGTGLYLSGILDFWENHTWDLRTRLWTAETRPNPDIALIMIDQNALDWASESLGLSWPWPREMYGAVTEFVRDAGAKAIVFDVIYSESSMYGVEDDQRFAQALGSIPSVGSLILKQDNGADGETDLLYNIASSTNFCRSSEFDKINLPVDELVTGFTMLGTVNSTLDSDGMIRRTQMVQCLHNTPIPSLSLATLMLLHPQKRIEISRQALSVGARRIALDGRGNALIRFHGAGGHYQTMSAAAVIQSKLLSDEGEPPLIDPTQLKDRIVIFGMSAPGLMDLRTTPFESGYPGAEVHATILDNLLTESFFTLASVWFLPIFALLMAAGVAYLILSYRALHSTILTVAAALMLVISIAYLFFELGIWLPLTPLMMAISTAALGAFALNYFREGRQRRFIRSAFSQYLSPAVIDQLIQNPDTLTLGGEQKTLSIFFSDIQGFTSISTKLEPVVLTQFLNHYLGALSDIILDLGGTIDKYEGDAIIAFWNAPLPQSDHAWRAVEAALRIQEHLKQNEAHYRELCGRTVKTRIGLHTGEVVVGNMGTQKRFDYTFIGDAGNLAARLEGANKGFGTYTMISEVTQRAVSQSFAFRRLGAIQVVGRDQGVNVFEPMRPRYFLEHQTHFERFERAVILLEAGALDEAKRIFETLLDDSAAQKYKQIVEAIRQHPEIMHNGVLVLDHK